MMRTVAGVWRKSVAALWLLCMFSGLAWAKGDITDDADFFRDNPYLGYELHTYGFEYVTGWKGTAQDIFDSILREEPSKNPETPWVKDYLVRPIFEMPVEWRPEWEKPDCLRLIFGTERSIFLWLLHDKGDDQSYWKYIDMRVRILDKDKKFVTEVPMRQGFTFGDLAPKLWEVGGHWDLPEYRGETAASGKFGFPKDALLTLDVKNIEDIRQALKRQGTKQLFFSISLDPETAGRYKNGYPEWLPWGFALWTLKGERVPTYAEARKGMPEVVRHLKDIHDRARVVEAVAVDLVAECFVNERFEFWPAPWLSLYAMLPVDALMHGEYRHQKHEMEAVPNSPHGRIRRHGVITRIPGKKKYNTDFPDKIVLDYRYYLSQEKLKKK